MNDTRLTLEEFRELERSFEMKKRLKIKNPKAKRIKIKRPKKSGRGKAPAFKVAKAYKRLGY